MSHLVVKRFLTTSNGYRNLEAALRPPLGKFCSAVLRWSEIFFRKSASFSNVIGVVSCILSGFVASIIS